MRWIDSFQFYQSSSGCFVEVVRLTIWMFLEVLPQLFLECRKLEFVVFFLRPLYPGARLGGDVVVFGTFGGRRELGDLFIRVEALI